MTDLRIGNGLDFHKLIEDPERPLILGGYVLPGESLALSGHSDADLILHSLADAIYGALGLGDIGYYFPDTDESIRGIDSKKIIAAALKSAGERGYRPLNVDITIIGERPKISKHREAIQESIAGILGIERSRVGLKATTTEKMGALGRKEGLGCLATVLMIKRDENRPDESEDFF